jgi:hypothetical protein
MVAKGNSLAEYLIAYADSWRHKRATSWRPSCWWTAITCGMVAHLTFQKPIPMPSTAPWLDHQRAPAGQQHIETRTARTKRSSPIIPPA